MEEDRYTRITLRIPKELHSQLQQAADDTSKSMNAEIVARLEQSFGGGDGSDRLSQTLKELESLQLMASLNYEIQRATMMVGVLHPQVNQAWWRLQEVLKSGSVEEQAKASASFEKLQAQMQRYMTDISDVEKDISAIHLDRKAAGLKELRDVQPVYVSMRGQWADTGLVKHNTAPKKPAK